MKTLGVFLEGRDAQARADRKAAGPTQQKLDKQRRQEAIKRDRKKFDAEKRVADAEAKAARGREQRLLKQNAAKERGLDDVRVQKSGCLDYCENGPTCVVYPEGEWFRLTEEAIPNLVEYLSGGKLPTEHSLDLKA